MDIQALCQMLIRYRRFCSMTDPVRYASTAVHQGPMPDYYGMDPRMFTFTPAQRAETILSRSDASDLFVKLLSGAPVDSGKMERVLGISYSALMECMAAMDPVKKPIPDKTIVITFDDAKRDHYTHVAPLLRELGFQATFFVTEMESSPMGSGFEDKSRFMTWEQIAALSAMGFEIGNHTLHHRRPAELADPAVFEAEMLELNERMASAGVPRACSVAYPFGSVSAAQVAAAGRSGMRWGRGNLDSGLCATAGKTTYDPRADSPLAIPSHGDAPLYTLERLKDRLETARDGRILCLAYHSVVETGDWMNEIGFEQHFRFIAEQGYHCLSMAQLEEYIDPEKALVYTAEGQ